MTIPPTSTHYNSYILIPRRTLQVRQLSLYKSCPCAFPPPLVHGIKTLPQRLFIYVVDLVLGTVERPTVSLCDFEGGLILPSAG